MNIPPNRVEGLDILKGIAIISVVLYHAGIMSYGYLGVDIFLVISGYLTTKSISKNYSTGDFNYFRYIRNRLSRLYPPALIATAVALGISYFVMLPVALKNVCETAIGTLTFTNNFVQYIVSQNYWDYSNEFKPLMHTWYIGLVFQFYLVFPLIFILAHKLKKVSIRHLVFVLFFISLLLFVTPWLTVPQKFYLLPARLFEFCMGSIIALSADSDKCRSWHHFTATFSGAILILLLALQYDISIASVRVLCVATFTAIVIKLTTHRPLLFKTDNLIFRVVQLAGIASYSIFLWHQVFLALYRYIIDYDFSPLDYTFITLTCFAAGIGAYFLIEKPLASTNKSNRGGVFATYIIASLIIFIPAAIIYRNMGIVRDIPELELSLSKPSESQDYNSRINYMYDRNFPSNGRANILVIGDSYARDWSNVLIEQGLDSIMNISYHRDIDAELNERIKIADYIFIASSISFYAEYERLFPSISDKNYYRVGVKSFGLCMGPIYNRPRGENYYKQTVTASPQALMLNNEEKRLFGNRYIDIMASLANSDGSIPAFTPNHKFISHDGLHLTRAGAQFVASRIDVSELLDAE